MDLSREGLFCKVESLVSTLCEIVWWAAILPSPMQINPEEVPTHQKHPQLGLKALTAAASEMENASSGSAVVHSYNIASSAPTSATLITKSSSWSSSSSSSYNSSSSSSSLQSLPRFLMGDLIGTESGVYMSSDEDLVRTAAVEKSKLRHNNGRQKKEVIEAAAMERKYPPPIPFLAGTGNLVAHMPWVLTRRCTSDGKLILTEERGKYQEYFEAKREHGRLLLSLVSLDNANGDDDKGEQMEEEEEEEEEDLYFMDGIHGRSEKDTERDQLFNDYFDIYDDDDDDDGSCDHEEKGKQPTKTTLASSMPEIHIPPVNINGKFRFGRRCLTFVDSRTSNMFHPMLNNIIYT